jgi:hypothetical protein
MARKQKAFADRFFLVRLTRDENKVRTAIILIAVLLLVLFANTAYLTYLSLHQQKAADAEKTTVTSPTAMPTVSPTTAVPTIVQATSAPVVQTGPQVKEIFIPFGSGTTQATSWTNVPGLTAQIDFGKYSNIKEVHFEATIGIPTQNQTASIQLFNVTDGHPVWYSPMTLVDGQFGSSNPIVWDSGPKVYQVQMMTSLGYFTNLYMARLHILLK